MPLRLTTLLAATLLLAAGVLAPSVAAAAAAAADEAAVAAKVRELVRRLDDDDFRTRHRAAMLLKNLPGDAWPAAQASLAAKGLGADARAQLEAAGRVLRARQLNETRYNDLAWNRESAVAAYDAAGRKNPKWDAAAREALTLYPRPGFDPRLRPADDAKRRAAFEAAIGAGCDDPLVVYCYARVLEEEGDEAPDRLQINRLYRQAADAIADSDYPAVRKCFVLARNANTLPPTAAAEPLRKVLALLPAVAREPGVRGSHVLALARICADGLGRSTTRSEGYKLAREAIDEAMPGKVEPLLLKGEYLAKLAYEAPPDPRPIPQGLQPPDPPPPDPQVDAIRRAEEALQQAYDLDPTDARAATLMLGLRARGVTARLNDFAPDDGADQGRPEVERWFRRAIEANPDNYDACLQKLEYLSADWRGGGPAEMLRFGRACAAEGNHFGRIPFVLAEAHYRVAQNQPNRDAYLRGPDVWPDIRAVYQTHLDLFPDHDYHRNGYAKWAAECGRWSEAKRLFDAIGDRPDLRTFGSEDAFEFYRDQATAGLAREAK